MYTHASSAHQGTLGSMRRHGTTKGVKLLMAPVCVRGHSHDTQCGPSCPIPGSWDDYKPHVLPYLDGVGGDRVASATEVLTSDGDQNPWSLFPLQPHFPSSQHRMAGVVARTELCGSCAHVRHSMCCVERYVKHWICMPISDLFSACMTGNIFFFRIF